MYRACIAIADAARARIFLYERTVDPSGTHERFEERVDLVDPARRERTSELFSSTNPGKNKTGGLQYGFDDHRDEHLDQFDAEFARSIMKEISVVAGDPGVQRLVICASPRMLGALRKLTASVERPGLAIDELARNFVKLPTAALREQLTAANLLPALPPRAGLQASR